MSLNNKPNNKSWWCFNCNKWIDKATETTTFPVYANNFHLTDSFKCNHCQHDTGTYQGIDTCTTCGKIVRIMGRGVGYDDNKNTFDKTKEELCSHQNDQNSPKGDDNKPFSRKSWLIGGTILVILLIGAWYLFRNKDKK